MKVRSPKHWVFWLPWTLIAVSITIVSHIPQPPRLMLGIQWSDKLLHLLAYLGFGVTFLWMIIGWRAQQTAGMLRWLVVLATAAFGLMDELHQSFVPGREADFWDWVADVSGGIVATVFLPWIREIKMAVLQKAKQ